MFNSKSLSVKAIKSASRIEGATVLGVDQMMKISGGAVGCTAIYVCGTNVTYDHDPTCDYPDGGVQDGC